MPGITARKIKLKRIKIRNAIRKKRLMTAQKLTAGVKRRAKKLRPRAHNLIEALSP